MKMDEEWPGPLRGTPPPLASRIEEDGERKHDAMANMVARPQSLQDYLPTQLGEFDIEPALRAMAERIIYNLDTNGYLKGSLDDLLGRDADAAHLELARSRPGAGAEARSARAWRPATCASACCCN